MTGWLKTVDQYYTGHNASIYAAQVQFIFDSVFTELQRNPKRKFTFCEISFFSRWYREQDTDTRAMVKRMVQSGQVTFVNGGWVMHDEASAHYVSMIDQTTLGHRFLKEELDFIPKVGWQIDPFGHSRTHAWLSSEVGFDALYFGRIDYQDHNKRMDEKTMEMVWKGSTSQPDAQVFTGVFHDGNYGPPSGFCFDTTCQYCRSDPAIADPLLSTYNIDSKVNDFIKAVYEEHSHSVGSNIMFKMGSDFAWDNARSWFKSLDLVMERVAKIAPEIHAFYSTPTDYTKARAAEGLTWTSKSDDFFPYSDCEHVSKSEQLFFD
jgi:alpha-mannosidase